MAVVSPARSNFDERELDYRSGVSESLLTKMGQQHVFVNQRIYQSHIFALNGPYFRAITVNGVEPIFRFPFNAEIFDVSMSNIVAGGSGTTELDIKIATTSGGAFSSIFSTTPKLTSAASSNFFGGIGDSITGFTAPVLNSVVVSEIDGKTVYEVDQGDGIRFDQISSMAAAENTGLIVYFRSR